MIMKLYAILTGRGRQDCRSRVTKVMCEESEIRMIANAVYRGEMTEYSRPIACVVKEGEGVDWSVFDICIADCI